MRLQHRQLLPIRRASFLPFLTLCHLSVLLHYQQRGEHLTRHRNQPYSYDCSRAGETVAIFVLSTLNRVPLQENGERLVGQCEISHPVRQAPGISISSNESPASPVDPLDGTLPRSRNVLFEAEGKNHFEPLNARIISKWTINQNRPSSNFLQGLFYINAYGNEIHPSPNVDYLSSMSRYNVLVYSCGSLWTRLVV